MDQKMNLAEVEVGDSRFHWHVKLNHDSTPWWSGVQDGVLLTFSNKKVTLTKWPTSPCTPFRIYTTNSITGSKDNPV